MNWTRFWRTSVSLINLICFITVSVAGANPAAPAGVSTQYLNPSLEALQFPDDVAKVEERFNGNGNDLVVLVQDAHCNFNAQTNIQKVIGALQETYGLKLIALEGGAGELDLLPLRMFPDASVKERVLKQYALRGEISGPEMAAVLNPADSVYFAIEDRAIYDENRGVFLEVEKNRKSGQEALDALRLSLNRIREKVWSTELKEIDEHFQRHDSGGNHLADYIQYLEQKAQSLGIRSDSYPAVANLIRQMAAEKEFEKDGSSFAGLARGLILDAENKIGPLLEGASKAAFGAKMQAYKTGNVSRLEAVKYLCRLASGMRLKLGNQEALEKVISGFPDLSELKASQFFEEVENWTFAVKEKLFKNDGERELDKVYRHLRILERLSRLEAARSDLTYYRARPAEFKPAYFREFLSKHGEIAEPFDFSLQERFYELALLRDEVLFKNLRRVMAEKKTSFALAVAGGFHTEGLKEHLKAAGISYAVVTPRIFEIGDADNYRRVMRGEISYLNGEKLKKEMRFEINRSDPRLVVEQLKQWRAAIINEALRKGRMAAAGEYTWYVDALFETLAANTSTLAPEIVGLKSSAARAGFIDSLDMDFLRELAASLRDPSGSVTVENMVRQLVQRFEALVGPNVPALAGTVDKIRVAVRENLERLSKNLPELEALYAQNGTVTPEQFKAALFGDVKDTIILAGLAETPPVLPQVTGADEFLIRQLTAKGQDQLRMVMTEYAERVLGIKDNKILGDFDRIFKNSNVNTDEQRLAILRQVFELKQSSKSVFPLAVNTLGVKAPAPPVLLAASLGSRQGLGDKPVRSAVVRPASLENYSPDTIVEHLVRYFSQPLEISLDEINRLEFLPPISAFPRDENGTLYPLSRREIAAILSKVHESLSQVSGDQEYYKIRRKVSGKLTNFVAGNFEFKLPFGLNAHSWLLVYMTILNDKLSRDYPGYRVLSLGRDGLIKPVSSFEAKADSLYWPGRFRDDQGGRFRKMHQAVTERSSQLLSEISRKHQIVTNPEIRKEKIEAEFISAFRALKKDDSIGTDIRQFFDWMKPQIRALALNPSQSLVVFDTFGSGKSALAVAAAIQEEFPEVPTKVILAISKGDVPVTKGELPDVSTEYGVPSEWPAEFSWPFEFKGITNSTPIFEKPAVPDVMMGLGLILASYNRHAMEGEFESEILDDLARGAGTLDRDGWKKYINDMALRYLFPDVTQAEGQRVFAPKETVMVGKSLGVDASQPLDFFELLARLKKISPEELRLFGVHFEQSGLNLARLMKEYETQTFANDAEAARFGTFLNRLGGELKRRGMAVEAVDYAGQSGAFNQGLEKSITDREFYFPLERASAVIRRNTLDEEILNQLYSLNSLRNKDWNRETRQEYEYILELLSRVAVHVNEDLREVMRKEILWFIEVAKGKGKAEREEILAPLLVFAYESLLINPEDKLANQTVWDAILTLGIRPEEMLQSLSFELPEREGLAEPYYFPMEFPTVESLDALKTAREVRTNRNWEWDESESSKREEIKERLAILINGGLVDYLKRKIAEMYPGKNIEIESVVIRGSYLYGPIETMGTDIDTTVYLRGETDGLPEMAHVGFDITGERILPFDYRRPVDKLDVLFKTTSEGEDARVSGVTIWGSGFTIYGKDPGALRPPAENILAKSLILLNSGIQHMRKQPFPRQDQILLTKYGKIVKRLSEGAKALKQINPDAELNVLDYYPYLIRYQQYVASDSSARRPDHQREFERAMREGYYETIGAILRTAETFDSDLTLGYSAAALEIINGIDEVTYERNLLMTPHSLYRELKTKVSGERHRRVGALLEQTAKTAGGASLGTEESLPGEPANPLLRALYTVMGPGAPDPAKRLLDSTHLEILEDFIDNQSPYFEFEARDLASLIEALFDPSIHQSLVDAFFNFEAMPSLREALHTRKFKEQRGVLLGIFFADWLGKMEAVVRQGKPHPKYEVEAVAVKINIKTGITKPYATPDAIVLNTLEHRTYLAEFKSAKDTKTLGELFANQDWLKQMEGYIEAILSAKTKDDIYPQYVYSNLPDGVLMGLPDYLVDETVPEKTRKAVTKRVKDWFNVRVAEIRAKMNPPDIRDEFKVKNPELIVEPFPQPDLTGGAVTNQFTAKVGIDAAKWVEIEKGLAVLRRAPVRLAHAVSPSTRQAPATAEHPSEPMGPARPRMTPEQRAAYEAERIEKESAAWADIVRNHFKVEEPEAIAKRGVETLREDAARLKSLLAGTRHEARSLELESRRALPDYVVELEKILYETVDESAADVMRAYWTSRPFDQRGKLRSRLQDMWNKELGHDGTWLKLRQDWVDLQASLPSQAQSLGTEGQTPTAAEYGLGPHLPFEVVLKFGEGPSGQGMTLEERAEYEKSGHVFGFGIPSVGNGIPDVIPLSFDGAVWAALHMLFSPFQAGQWTYQNLTGVVSGAAGRTVTLSDIRRLELWPRKEGAFMEVHRVAVYLKGQEKPVLLVNDIPKDFGPILPKSTAIRIRRGGQPEAVRAGTDFWPDVPAGHFMHYAFWDSPFRQILQFAGISPANQRVYTEFNVLREWHGMLPSRVMRPDLLASMRVHWDGGKNPLYAMIGEWVEGYLESGVVTDDSGEGRFRVIKSWGSADRPYEAVTLSGEDSQAVWAEIARVRTALTLFKNGQARTGVFAINDGPFVIALDEQDRLNRDRDGRPDIKIISTTGRVIYPEEFLPLQLAMDSAMYNPADSANPQKGQPVFWNNPRLAFESFIQGVEDQRTAGLEGAARESARRTAEQEALRILKKAQTIRISPQGYPLLASSELGQDVESPMHMPGNARGRDLIFRIQREDLPRFISDYEKRLQEEASPQTTVAPDVLPGDHYIHQQSQVLSIVTNVTAEPFQARVLDTSTGQESVYDQAGIQAFLASHRLERRMEGASLGEMKAKWGVSLEQADKAYIAAILPGAEIPSLSGIQEKLKVLFGIEIKTELLSKALEEKGGYPTLENPDALGPEMKVLTGNPSNAAVVFGEAVNWGGEELGPGPDLPLAHPEDSTTERLAKIQRERRLFINLWSEDNLSAANLLPSIEGVVQGYEKRLAESIMANKAELDPADLLTQREWDYLMTAIFGRNEGTRQAAERYLGALGEEKKQAVARLRDSVLRFSRFDMTLTPLDPEAIELAVQNEIKAIFKSIRAQILRDIRQQNQHAAYLLEKYLVQERKRVEKLSSIRSPSDDVDMDSHIYVMALRAVNAFEEKVIPVLRDPVHRPGTPEEVAAAEQLHLATAAFSVLFDAPFGMDVPGNDPAEVRRERNLAHANKLIMFGPGSPIYDALSTEKEPGDPFNAFSIIQAGVKTLQMMADNMEPRAISKEMEAESPRLNEAERKQAVTNAGMMRGIVEKLREQASYLQVAANRLSNGHYVIDASDSEPDKAAKKEKEVQDFGKSFENAFANMSAYLTASDPPEKWSQESWQDFLAKALSDEPLLRQQAGQIAAEEPLVQNKKNLAAIAGLKQKLEELRKDVEQRVREEGRNSERLPAEFLAREFLAGRDNDHLFEFAMMLYHHLRWKEGKVRNTRPVVIFVDPVHKLVSFNDWGGLKNTYREIRGTVDTRGGQQSHYVIDITHKGGVAITGAHVPMGGVESGAPVIIDGTTGTVYVHPTVRRRVEMYRKRDRVQLMNQFLISRAKEPVNIGKTEIHTLGDAANVDELSDAPDAAWTSSGVSGIALFRLENILLEETREGIQADPDRMAFAFTDALGSNLFHAPPEGRLRGRATFRLFDVQADKIPDILKSKIQDADARREFVEKNPGIAFYLQDPDYWHFGVTQLKALFLANYRSPNRGKMNILFPMVETQEHVDKINQMWAEAAKAALVELRNQEEILTEEELTRGILKGFMIETVKGLENRELLIRHSDFVSIGTNDMTESIIRQIHPDARRTDSKYAAEFNKLQPALLAAIWKAAQEAIRQGKPLAICGEWGSTTRIGNYAAALKIKYGAEVYSVASLNRSPAQREHLRNVSLEDITQIFDPLFSKLQNGESLTDGDLEPLKVLDAEVAERIRDSDAFKEFSLAQAGSSAASLGAEGALDHAQEVLTLLQPERNDWPKTQTAWAALLAHQMQSMGGAPKTRAILTQALAEFNQPQAASMGSKRLMPDQLVAFVKEAAASVSLRTLESPEALKVAEEMTGLLARHGRKITGPKGAFDLKKDLDLKTAAVFGLDDFTAVDFENTAQAEDHKHNFAIYQNGAIIGYGGYNLAEDKKRVHEFRFSILEGKQTGRGYEALKLLVSAFYKQYNGLESVDVPNFEKTAEHGGPMLRMELIATQAPLFFVSAGFEPVGEVGFTNQGRIQALREGTLSEEGRVHLNREIFDMDLSLRLTGREATAASMGGEDFQSTLAVARTFVQVLPSEFEAVSEARQAIADYLRYYLYTSAPVMDSPESFTPDNIRTGHFSAGPRVVVTQDEAERMGKIKKVFLHPAVRDLTGVNDKSLESQILEIANIGLERQGFAFGASLGKDLDEGGRRLGLGVIASPAQSLGGSAAVSGASLPSAASPRTAPAEGASLGEKVPLMRFIAFLEEADEDLFSDIQQKIHSGQSFADAVSSFRVNKKFVDEETRDLIEGQFSSPERAAVELVSNAVDSYRGAPIDQSKVDVSFDGRRRFAVRDRGEGMSLETILTKLLIPQATGKEGREGIGRFGIGFYSILGFLKEAQDKVVVRTGQGGEQSYQLTFTYENGDYFVSVDTVQESRQGTDIEIVTPGRDMDLDQVKKVLAEGFEFNIGAEINLNEDGRVVRVNDPERFQKYTFGKFRVGFSSDRASDEEGSLVVSVSGVKITSHKTKGFDLPATLVVDFPPGTELNIARSQLTVTSRKPRPDVPEELPGLVQNLQELMDAIAGDADLSDSAKLALLNALYPLMRELQKRNDSLLGEDNLETVLRKKAQEIAKREAAAGKTVLPTASIFKSLAGQPGIVWMQPALYGNGMADGETLKIFQSDRLRMTSDALQVFVFDFSRLSGDVGSKSFLFDREAGMLFLSQSFFDRLDHLKLEEVKLLLTEPVKELLGSTTEIFEEVKPVSLVSQAPERIPTREERSQSILELKRTLLTRELGEILFQVLGDGHRRGIGAGTVLPTDKNDLAQLQTQQVQAGKQQIKKIYHEMMVNASPEIHRLIDEVVDSFISRMAISHWSDFSKTLSIFAEFSKIHAHLLQIRDWYGEYFAKSALYLNSSYDHIEDDVFTDLSGRIEEERIARKLNQSIDHILNPRAGLLGVFTGENVKDKVLDAFLTVEYGVPSEEVRARYNAILHHVVRALHAIHDSQVFARLTGVADAITAIAEEIRVFREKGIPDELVRQYLIRKADFLDTFLNPQNADQAKRLDIFKDYFQYLIHRSQEARAADFDYNEWLNQTIRFIDHLQNMPAEGIKEIDRIGYADLWTVENIGFINRLLEAGQYKVVKLIVDFDRDMAGNRNNVATDLLPEDIRQNVSSLMNYFAAGGRTSELTNFLQGAHQFFKDLNTEANETRKAKETFEPRLISKTPRAIRGYMKLIYGTKPGSLAAVEREGRVDISRPSYGAVTSMGRFYQHFRKNENAQEQQVGFDQIPAFVQAIEEQPVTDRQRETFGRRINQAVKHVSPDPFIFLREMLQNSRDAVIEHGIPAADRDFQVSMHEETVGGQKKLYVSMADKVGMDFNILKNFLFVLGSSSKRGIDELIGQYGTGFFTIFRDAEEVLIKTSVGNGEVIYVRMTPVLREGTTDIEDIRIELERVREEGFKGTIIQQVRKTDFPEMAAAYVQASLMTYGGVLDPEEIRVKVGKEQINTLKKELMAEVETRFGPVRFYYLPGENTLTQAGLYLNEIGGTYEKWLGEGGLELVKRNLLKAGIVIDLPPDLELIKDRSDIKDRERILQEIGPMIQVGSVNALLKLFVTRKLTLPEIPYDLFYNSGNIVVPQPILEDAAKLIQGQALNPVSLIKYLANKENVTLLILSMKLFEGRSIMDLVTGFMAGTIPEDELPAEIREKLGKDIKEKKETEAKQREQDIGENFGLYGAGYQGQREEVRFNRDLSLPSFNPADTNQTGFEAYFALADLTSKIGGLITGSPFETMFYARPDGSGAHASRTKNGMGWNLYALPDYLKFMREVLASPADDSEGLYKIAKTIVHEIAHVREGGTATHHVQFYEVQLDNIARFIAQDENFRAFFTQWKATYGNSLIGQKNVKDFSSYLVGLASGEITFQPETPISDSRGGQATGQSLPSAASPRTAPAEGASLGQESLREVKDSMVWQKHHGLMLGELKTRFQQTGQPADVVVNFDPHDDIRRMMQGWVPDGNEMTWASDALRDGLTRYYVQVIPRHEKLKNQGIRVWTVRGKDLFGQPKVVELKGAEKEAALQELRGAQAVVTVDADAYSLTEINRFTFQEIPVYHTEPAQFGEQSAPLVNFLTENELNPDPLTYFTKSDGDEVLLQRWVAAQADEAYFTALSDHLAASMEQIRGAALGAAEGMEETVLSAAEAEKIFGPKLLSLFDEAEKLRTREGNPLALQLEGGVLREAAYRAFVDANASLSSFESDVDGRLFDPQNPKGEVSDSLKRQFAARVGDILKRNYQDVDIDYYEAVQAHEAELVLNRLTLEKVAGGYRLTGPKDWRDDFAETSKVLRIYFPPGFKLNTDATGVQLYLSRLLPFYALANMLSPGIFEIDDASKKFITELMTRWRALSADVKTKMAAQVIDSMERRAVFEGAYEFVRSMTWLPFDPLEFYEGTPQKKMLISNGIWGASLGAASGNVKIFPTLWQMVDALGILDPDAEITLLPYLWEGEWNGSVKQLIGKMRSSLSFPNSFYGKAEGQAALSVRRDEKGALKYAVLISEVAERHPEPRGEGLTGYHRTSLQKALGIMTFGKYSLPGRTTFWVDSVSAKESVKENEVILAFKLTPQEALLRRAQNGSDTLAPAFLQQKIGVTPDPEFVKQLKQDNSPVERILLSGAENGLLTHKPPEDIDTAETFILNTELARDGKLSLETLSGLYAGFAQMADNGKISRRNFGEIQKIFAGFQQEVAGKELAAAASLGDDEERSATIVARVIIKQSVGIQEWLGRMPDIMDIEKVRDPNQLAMFIVQFGNSSLRSPDITPAEREAFFVNILDKVLSDEKVNQMQYRDEYLQALRNAIRLYFDRSGEPEERSSRFQIPNTLLWRPYDVTRLAASLEALKGVWTAGQFQTLPLDKIRVRSIGHGVQTTHTEEDDIRESGDLINAGRILNDAVSKGRRLAEEEFRSMHHEVAAHITVIDPMQQTRRPALRGFYRSAPAFRDLTQYPPYESTLSYQEREALWARYGLADEVSPELEARVRKRQQASAQVEQARKALDELKARAEQAAEDLKPGPQAIESAEQALSQAEGAMLQVIEEDIRLNRLMKKFFSWLDKRLDTVDAIYKQAVQAGTVPQEYGYPHPAVLLAAQAFNRLINIHPFENGNTRTSWLVANYVLLRYGYPAFILTDKNQKSFFDIERFGRFNREIYWDTTQDISKWMTIENADEELAALFTDEILAAAPQAQSLGNQEKFNDFVWNLVAERHGIDVPLRILTEAQIKEGLGFFFAKGTDRKKALAGLENALTRRLDEYAAQTAGNLPGGFEAVARRILFEGLGENKDAVEQMIKAANPAITDEQVKTLLADIEGVMGSAAVTSFSKQRDGNIVTAMSEGQATPEDYEKAFNKLAEEKGFKINLMRPDTVSAETNLAVAVHINSLPKDLSPAVFHAMVKRVGERGQLFLVFRRTAEEDRQSVAKLLAYLTHEEKSRVSRLPYVGELPVAEIGRQLSKVKEARKIMVMNLEYLKQVGDKILGMKDGRETALFEYDGKTPAFLAGPILSLVMSDAEAEALFREFPDVVKKESLGNGFFFVSFDLEAFITLLNDRIAAEREVQKAA